MNAATTICCSALALIAAASSSSSTAAPEKKTAPLALVPTQPVWSLALNNQLTAPPAYDDTRAYFSIEHDRLVAYDIMPGKQLWIEEAQSILQPAAGGDLVFVVERDRIRALHAQDGSTAWEFATPQALGVRPVWNNGWLLGVTSAGTVVAVRADDGRLVWSRDLNVAAHAPPSIAGEYVYLPTADSRIVALNIADGSTAWERKIGGLPNEILPRGERLYVGSTDNFFYCLMMKDGRIDWRWRTGADIVGAPVADDERVYFVSLDNVLRAMQPTSGAQLWLRALPLRPTSGPVVAGSTVLVVGQTPAIRAFNAKDGTPSLDINAVDELAAPPHLLQDPRRGLPMVLFVTRHITRGAVAVLHVRSIEPPILPTVAPLPNPVKPAPTPARD